MIDLSISKEIIEDAIAFSNFRNVIKNILIKCNLHFDKFTITDRDSFDGFIAEKIFREYLEKNRNISADLIRNWEDEHPIPKEIITKIHNKLQLSREDLELTKNYFYDKWDLKINKLHVDVKTAATHLEPKEPWTYGIPKIQVEKAGKDIVVLNYLIYDKDPKKFKDAKPVKCVLIGGMSIADIKKCPIKTINDFAGHKYQVENYETKISEYHDIEGFLK